MINIPKNDYVENTSINEETVQGICNAFLNGKVWHPLSAGAVRKCNNMLMAYGGKDQPFKTAEWLEERKAEAETECVFFGLNDQAAAPSFEQ